MASKAQERLLGIPELTEQILVFLPIRDLLLSTSLVCKEWLAHTEKPKLQKCLFLKAEKESEEQRTATNQKIEQERTETQPRNAEVDKDTGEDLTPSIPALERTEGAGEQEESREGEEDREDGAMMEKGGDGKDKEGEEGGGEDKEIKETEEPVDERAYHMKGYGTFQGASPFEGPLSYESSVPVLFNPLLFREVSVAQQDALMAEDITGSKFKIVHAPIYQPENPGHEMLLTQPAQNRVCVTVEAQFFLAQGTQSGEFFTKCEFAMQDATGVRIGNLMEAIDLAVDALALPVQRQVQQDPSYSYCRGRVYTTVIDQRLVPLEEDGDEEETED